jgi:Dolichyl-phosphate-mannose-protein mannosyltransferase
MDGRTGDARWIARATWGFVAVGLTLRVLAYLLNFPLWWDEAFVAVNLLRRNFAGLLRPLDYGQVCPLLFLWAELAIVRLLGFSEWSLRLFPLLCALASVLVFRVAAVRLLEAWAALVAVGVFAVAVHPIRHAADLKPYSLDLLVALILQALAIRWWSRPESAGRLLLLAAFGPVALACSHPAAFVAGGVGLAIAWPAWKTSRASVRIALLAYLLAIAVAQAGLYAWFTGSQASSASGSMRVMWAQSFPPLDSAVGFLRWLVVVHTGDLMAYPCGSEGGASVLSLVACLAGAWFLIRSGRSVVVAILLGPLLLAMVAAGLRLYPYGGPAPHGSAARIMQYAAPGLCLLIGLGLSRGLDRGRALMGPDRPLRLVCLGLLVVGVAPLVEGFRHPYRAYQAEAARRFARGFWPEVGRGAEVACLRWDYGVAEWDSVRLGIAVSLCNQAIYSPSRRAGGPKWEAVSAEKPLRCVLGVEAEADGSRVESWLSEMSEQYRLTRRDVIPVDTAEPGRPPRLERYEVFEFVPRLEDGQSVKGS